jgi:hypothetical protein
MILWDTLSEETKREELSPIISTVDLIIKLYIPFCHSELTCLLRYLAIWINSYDGELD